MGVFENFIFAIIYRVETLKNDVQNVKNDVQNVKKRSKNIKMRSETSKIDPKHEKRVQKHVFGSKIVFGSQNDPPGRGGPKRGPDPPQKGGVPPPV